MGFQDLPGTIRWRIHLHAPPEQVFEVLDSQVGRESFWAESASERAGFIHFEFLNGMEHRAKIMRRKPPQLFSLEYFGGSTVTFELEADGHGGTDLSLEERDVPEAHRSIHIPGWIPVLLTLKASVDFAVDLRNHDPRRTWEEGYVDV